MSLTGITGRRSWCWAWWPLVGRARRQIRPLIALVSVASCVKIQTQTTYTETFVEDQTAVNTVAGSVQYHPAATLDGTTLVVKLQRDERCQTVVTPVYSKVAHHVREPEATSLFQPRYVALFGAVALGAGAASYFGADMLAEGDPNDPNNKNQPSDYRSLGLFFGATGIALLTLATVDQIRLRDTDVDLGTVKRYPTAPKETRCTSRPVSSQKVVLLASRADWRADGTTDPSGVVRFALQDIPEPAFSETDLDLKLEVVANSVPLVLPVETVAALHTALLADHNSRLVRDREAKAAATCEAGIAAAREAQGNMKENPDDAISAWKSAKAACGSRWNDDRERELTQALALARDALGRAFDAAIEASIRRNSVSMDDLARAETLIATLGASSPPDPNLDSRTKKLAATRKSALDLLLDLAARQISKGDLDGAQSNLDSAQTISADDPRLDRVGAAITAAEAARQKREEAAEAALEKREDAKRRAEERQREKREGPVWTVEAICVGQGVIATQSVRARSKQKAMEKACVEFCDGYPASVHDDCETSCTLGWVMTTSGQVRDQRQCSVHAGR